MNPSENLTKLTGCCVVINACSVYNFCEKNKYRGEAELFRKIEKKIVEKKCRKKLDLSK